MTREEILNKYKDYTLEAIREHSNMEVYTDFVNDIDNYIVSVLKSPKEPYVIPYWDDNEVEVNMSHDYTKFEAIYDTDNDIIFIDIHLIANSSDFYMKAESHFSVDVPDVKTIEELLDFIDSVNYEDLIYDEKNFELGDTSLPIPSDGYWYY